MTWDWGRLSDEVRRLNLPAGEYAVDQIGYGLSRDHSSTADRVAVLVTDIGWRRLKERAWKEQDRDTLLHPGGQSLSARLVVLESVRHAIREVDGIPVVAVKPDPPAKRAGLLHEWSSTLMPSAILMIVIGAMVYGFAVLYPTPGPRTTWQHLTFRTTKVEATVETWHKDSTCTGARVYDTSPRIDMVFSWIEEGQTTVGSYTACGASTDSPQDIWVTAEGDVASQKSPWVDHLWPAMLVGLAPGILIVSPVLERLRRWRSRRQRT